MAFEKLENSLMGVLNYIGIQKKEMFWPGSLTMNYVFKVAEFKS